MGKKSWDIIACTCSQQFSSFVEEELKYLQKKLKIPTSTAIFTIEDPCDNIGSGAATLNALIVITEYLSAQNDYTAINSDVLKSAHVLIFHLGKHSIYSYCGNAFIELPLAYSTHPHSFSTNIELLLCMVEKLQRNVPSGIWICGTNVSLLHHGTSQIIEPSSTYLNPDCILFCVEVDANYAVNHGAVSIDKQNFVGDILYCGPESLVQNLKQNDGLVPIVSGIVYLSPDVVESLLHLHVATEFQNCTYMGIDSGIAVSAQVSLYFDILLAMGTSVQKTKFLMGCYGEIYNKKAEFLLVRLQEMQHMRSLIWDKLSNYKMIPVMLECCQHIYWSDLLPMSFYLKNLLSIAPFGLYHAITSVEPSNKVKLDFLLLNCELVTKQNLSISDGVMVFDSRIHTTSLDIKQGCIISGLDYVNHQINLFTCLRKDIAVINCNLLSPDADNITLVFGVHDHLHLPISNPNSTFVNQPWIKLFRNFPENCIWSEEIEPMKKTLFNAKLYTDWLSLPNFLLLLTNPHISDINRWKQSKRYSMADVIKLIDFRSQLKFRREIFSTIACATVTEKLHKQENFCLLPYIDSAYSGGWVEKLMKSLDSCLVTFAEHLETDPKKFKYETRISRTLFAMADLLACMAGKCGGLRNGPGLNKSFSYAFQQLNSTNVTKAINALKKERENWCSKPTYLMRAARHYETAAQLVISLAVHTAEEFVKLEPSMPSSMDHWVQVECPARIDLQGGWTDTPPISYELGGSVINVAITLDGKKPIGAKARRIARPCIELAYSADGTKRFVSITEMEHILDFNQPHAKGALLKAALIYLNILNFKSTLSLKDQLKNIISSGIEIHTWSNFPQGCGLGTSSILAGAIISCLWTVIGKKFDNSSIIHAVLCIEQILTTGGGWQDQVGGIFGGIKHGFSEPRLPHKIEVTSLLLSSESLKTLNSHLILIYTGKVRLAKNLLQTVIRNWYAKDPKIVSCFERLIQSSLDMKKAIFECNLEKMGRLLNLYREQKLVLAPGCEPDIVKKIINAVQPLVYGQSLTGAGGGGFMCVITKRPNMLLDIQRAIESVTDIEKITAYCVTIDTEGLIYT